MIRHSLFILMFLPVLTTANSFGDSINFFSQEVNKAPTTHYLGEARLHSIIRADSDENYSINRARFKANFNFDGHKHTAQQVLLIIEGEGYYQERGKEPVLLKKGRCGYLCPDTEYWHASK